MDKKDQPKILSIFGALTGYAIISFIFAKKNKKETEDFDRAVERYCKEFVEENGRRRITEF